ncbi:MAG: S9 family peptidase [Phycisphaerales bacterium]|nr:S9 family peptidase [Phycisphaerales bacterium]
MFHRIALGGLGLSVAAALAAAGPLQYPKSRTVEHVDEYHGQHVQDPFRWLEDDARVSTDVSGWVEAQNEVTFAYLASIPEREAIKDRLTKLWNYERYSSPFKRGERYFFYKNDGLQNQSVLFVADALDGEPRVLLDPNTLTADGTVALSGVSIRDDGRLMAYGLATAGSDWNEWRVRDIDTGKDLPDVVRWVKFSGASWTKDGKGFFYSRFDAPAEGEAFQQSNLNQKLYYHRLGTDQSEDVLVYKRPDQPEWGFSSGVTEDGDYLIISVWKAGPQNLLFCKPLNDHLGLPIELLNEWEAEYSFIYNDGPIFYLKTDLGAPKGKVVAVDIRNPAKENWKTIIPEAGETLQGVGATGNMLVASYLKDATTQVRMFGLNGRHIRDVQFPGLGTAGGFGGRMADTETFYSFSSFTAPPTSYRYDMLTGESEVFRRAQVDFNPDDYEAKQVFYSSKDGTRVPMFIVHKKGLKLDGTNPTLLYAYGGFGISLTPSFSVSNLAWMEMGGVYAQPNLRGGGEYGEEWHQAGTKLQKQNVFDDFIAAAEWLIANNYTTPSKLAIAGGSNGGLLVGACMTQRPELFGAALPAVGVMDMLRFHKFTIGRAWVHDYGSSDDPEQFQALLAYSPYHALLRQTGKGMKYPATMVTTADTDDRVVPGHSFKFAAALQQAHAGDAPALIRIETKAGHGAGKPTSKIIEEAADRWAFLVKNLGMHNAFDR